MKHKIKQPSFLSLAKLAMVPFLLALMSVASLAYATDYTCDGGSNPVPENVTGTVNIALISENCVIDHDVTATSLITIQTTAFAGSGSIKTKKLTSINSDIIVKAPNNSITTKQIKAGWGVNIEAATIVVDGSITAQIDQTSASHFPANPSYHTSVLLRANGNISTGTIRTDGGLGLTSIKTGGIQIDANLSGAPVEFVIGGPGANGVDGSLITTSSIAGGGDPGEDSLHIHGGVRITNGIIGSTGGIRLIDMANIRVRSSQSRSGMIILNAQGGTLTLPTGKLNAEGMPGQSGGLIFLGAKTIDAQDDTTISTNQDAGTISPLTNHPIFIAAETIKFRGTNGLKILADGNSLTGFNTIYIGPLLSIFPKSTNQLNGLKWTFDPGSANNALTFDGTGDGVDTAPLLIRANGNDTSVFVNSYPVNFIGGDVTLRSRGTTNHNVYLGYFGAFTDKQEMEVSSTGNFVLDADGKLDEGASQAAGGNIQVSTDQTLLNASGVHILNANGNPSNGDGGTIAIKHGSVVLTTKAVISADGAHDGIGNAVHSPFGSNGPLAVSFETGSNDVVLGQGLGRFLITATGGARGGNAGSVKVNSQTNKIFVHNSTAVVVSALGDVGNGGTIELASTSTEIGVTGFVPNLALEATGGTQTGEGGHILVPQAVGPNGDYIKVTGLMDVRSGKQEKATTFNGSISINGELCQQWKTDETAFPLNYWNCIDASSSSDFYTPLLALHPSMRGLLIETKKVDIFAFTSTLTGHKLFFSDSSIAADLFGISTVSPSPKTTSVFFQAGSQDIANEVPNTLMHEIGHQLDFAWGNGTVSGAVSQSNTAWLAAVAADEAAFNILPCQSVIDANLSANASPNKYCNHSSNIGKTNWQLVDKALGRATNSAFARRERFAVAFGYAYQPIVSNEFDIKIQAYFTNENAYMTQLKANGTP